MADSQHLAKVYQKKSDRQHVLDNPDTYTGSMESTDCNTYIFDNDTIISKNITIVPGLYKLFDEGAVNCRDHHIRQSLAIAANKQNTIPVTRIEFNITDDGIITMTNDGNGIDVAKHPEHDVWIPEMIFGHLRTSTNYDKTQKRIVGGKNGFGFKLVLIWSKWGRIETIDHVRKLKYVQEFKNNLTEINPPTITKCRNKPYTTVSFKPDYARLGLTGLSKDMLALFKRRIYDIAAVTDQKVRVKYNNEVLPIRHFQQYVDLYIGSKDTTKRIYEEANKRWEYAVCLSPKEEFTQVSFVNGIFTSKGGKHVDYLLGQIIRKLTAYILQKKKVTVKASTIKEQLMLFIRCDIENPTFDSQTKDYMTTPSSKFGSTCEVSDKFIEKIAKLGVMDAACALTEVKDNKAAKKTDGNKSKTIRGIHKLVDANDAGTANSNECTLLLVEGDSAKAGTVSGLSKDDRRTIGVYPLRGKLMNVRGEKTKKINENKEIGDIKQILGLETGKKYTPESAKEKLRYGHIIFLTDQDLDGTHIKALCVNLFDSEWATLLAIPGFIGFMNTPILKARKGHQELIFYNDGEYEQWKKTSPDTTGWNIKYYKGLGTSTAKEFKEYFAKKKIVSFNCSGTECKNAIDMVFNKKRSLERKEWLEAYDRSLYMNTDVHNVTYKEFINNEMIHFSKYDCDRSIPNIMDGLKTSQRKILFAAFKRNLKSEIKVAQFSGYVSEHSAYHHGEQSLNGAIVNMAQDYVGSNNVNLFIPNGQFGTRLQGGNDSASERYIFTQLNTLTRLIFRQEDDVILRYLDDDGTSVEPVWYAPIIPMILINGSKGIGTGFSTDVPSFNPIQIVTYMKNKLTNQNTACDIEPYYEGFKGTVTKIMPYKYLIKGVYEVINSKQVRITELPIGCWTDDYKEYLEKLIEGDGKKRGSIVKDYTDMSTDCLVDITITFAVGKINELATKSEGYGCTALDKLLKIYTTQTTTNMHMFDHEEKLRKFASPQDIIDYYMNVRLNVYTNRKKTQLAILKQEITKLSNKAKFILENLNDTIDLRRKKNTEVSVLLEKHGYDIIDNDKAYKYLVRMPMDSVTEENVKLLMNDRDSKQTEFTLLEATTETQMWINELDYFLEQYTTYQKKRVEIMYETSTSTSKHKGKGKSKSIRKKHYTFEK